MSIADDETYVEPHGELTISQIIADLKATCAPESDVGHVCRIAENQYNMANQLTAALDEAQHSLKLATENAAACMRVANERQEEIERLRSRDFCEMDDSEPPSHKMDNGRLCVACWNAVCEERNQLRSKLAAHDACLTQVREEMPEIEKARDDLPPIRQWFNKLEWQHVDALFKAVDTLQKNEARWRNARDVWDAERKRLEQTCQILRCGQDNMGSVIAAHVSDKVELQRQLSASNAACEEMREALETIAQPLPTVPSSALVQAYKSQQLALKALAAEPNQQEQP